MSADARPDPPSGDELWRRLEEVEHTHGQILTHLLRLLKHNAEQGLPTPEAVRWAAFEKHYLPRYQHARAFNDDFPSARAEQAETLDSIQRDMRDAAALLATG